MVWEDKVETEFNLDVAYMRRLDALCQNSTQFFFDGDYANWLNALRGLFLELSPEFSEEETKEIRERFDNLNIEINNYDNLLRTRGVEVNKLKIINKIEDIDILLRKRMKIRGLQGRNKQAAGEAL